MILLCPVCSFSFHDYVEQELEVDSCPSCFCNLRNVLVKSWQNKCGHCKSDIGDKVYRILMDNQSANVDFCPDCNAHLRTVADKGKDTCPACNQELNHLNISGNLIFNIDAVKEDGNVDYMTRNTVVRNLDIMLQCKNCGFAVDFNLIVDRNNILNKLRNNLKIADY